jgi:hypothetical protein
VKDEDAHVANTVDIHWAINGRCHLLHAGQSVKLLLGNDLKEGIRPIPLFDSNGIVYLKSIGKYGLGECLSGIRQ